MLKTYGPPRTDAVPIGVDYVSTEPQQLLTAYYPGTAGILDLETGKTVLSFDCSDDGACVCWNVLLQQPVCSRSSVAINGNLSASDNGRVCDSG
jgi:hypothetical protein